MRANSSLRAFAVPLLAVSLLALSAGVAPARQGATSHRPSAGTRIADVPFGPGESAKYQVKLGALSVGSGAMEVLETELVNGHLTYHARLRVSGGTLLARVDDRFDSWIDVGGIFSRRFKQNQRELTFRRNRTYEFFPESLTFRRLDNGEVGSIPTGRPMDDVSILYYARTLPLRVGETYTIPDYFKEDGNPVRLVVLRRETVTVPAGTFRTVVVRPIIKTDGLFGEGGEAEVYFTDDERRLMVMMRSKVPLVGSLNLYMTEYEPGRSLLRDYP